MMHGVVTAVEEDMQEVRQTRCWQEHQLAADSGDLAEVETEQQPDKIGSDLANFVPTDGINSVNVFPEINNEEKVTCNRGEKRVWAYFNDA